MHQVARHLNGAESVLSLMGYAPRASRPSDTGEINDPACLVLEGVLDPDLISRLALDCLIAYCECQVSCHKVLSKIMITVNLKYKPVH